MRALAIGLGLTLAAAASAQTIDNVYNRDTHDPFKLKEVKVERTVIGPIVRTSALLTFDNPYKKLTEASLWFSVPQAGALSGFAYYYGDEYVKGRLMDKAKAWFIYTAITSRNRDPGIMDQVNPNYYHAQIYPLKAGSDLKVRLYTVGTVMPTPGSTNLPTVEFGIAPNIPKNQTVRIGHGLSAPVSDSYSLPALPDGVHAVAQRFRDGRVYVVGVVKNGSAEEPAEEVVKGLKEVKAVPLTEHSFAFMGWSRRNGTFSAKCGGVQTSFRPQMIYKGSEAARLWAQQKLANWGEGRAKDVLRFSLKYGVPSSQTALLAVPNAEMKLFRAKERAYQKKAAMDRRRQREQARREREWAKKHPQNWNRSTGGDPEIRVEFPNARTVYAVLPDGRVLTLREANGFWGTNFEIPVGVPEGKYEVRLIAVNRDGTRQERRIGYDVDRTPPNGKVELKVVDGHLRIEVRAEAGLSQVAAWLPDGTKLVFKEVEPGLYRAELPTTAPIRFTVVLTDGASNKRSLPCSWPR